MRQSGQNASRTTTNGCSSWALHSSRLLSSAQPLQLCLAALFCTVPGTEFLLNKRKLLIPRGHSSGSEEEEEEIPLALLSLGPGSWEKLTSQLLSLLPSSLKEHFSRSPRKKP